MNAPVDLTNLREMIDGDTEMEKALFEEFFSAFEAGIASLSAHTSEATAETWRKEAHALKGMALNLGANGLGTLCNQGQNEPNAPADIKNGLLKNIREEYEQVKQYLLTL